MLAGAALLPHPPIILPAHAAERGDEVEATIVAVRAACDWVARELRPDRLVVSSPHPAHGFDVPLHFLREAMGTLPPIVQKFDASSLPVCLITLKGQGLNETQLRDLGQYNVRNQIASVPGASVPQPSNSVCLEEK